MRIAIVGKGGSGKSVIAGTTARLLAREGRKVLALDFDTVPGFAYTLGLRDIPSHGLPEELSVRRKKTGWALKKRVAASTLVTKYALDAPDGIRFLQLGKLPGAVKPASNFAFRHVATTFKRRGWSLVGDFAAGTRQPFFGWASFATALLVVVEPSQAAIISARRLQRLRESIPGAAMGAMLSKIRTPQQEDALRQQMEQIGLPIWGVVPYDVGVAEADRHGRALIDVAPDAPAVAAIREMISTVRSLPATEQT